MRRARIIFTHLVCLTAALLAQDDSPRVVSLGPENGDFEVDASGVSELVVVFDRPMMTRGWSFVGGGPTFPDIPPGRTPRWKDRKTCVLPVRLVPDRTYSLRLNNGTTATNFRSAKGVPLAPVSWSFATLPDSRSLPRKSKQKKINRKALRELEETLARHYSYYDHRGLDWKKLFRQHGKKINACRTTRGWAGRVGQMLAATNDIHVHLRLGDLAIPAGRRAVDTMYREALLSRHVGTVGQAGRGALSGRTHDDIGYLMVSSWTKQVDLAAIEGALSAMKDCKGVIVDVRPNSGGDELMARRIAGWFVKGTRTYAGNRYRVRKGRNGFGPILERKITGHGGGKFLDVPVVVLTSRYVMSSCEAFVLMMRQAPRCTVVGQRTWGSSGNPKPHELSNGVTIVLPSWLALRPDGTCFEGEGLAPDIIVQATSATMAKDDPFLARALSVLREGQ